MKKILIYIALLMPILVTSANKSCTDLFGINKFKQPCECFYQSRSGFSLEYQNKIQDLFTRLELYNISKKKNFFDRVEQRLSEITISINSDPNSQISSDNKNKFFALSGYLTCKIGNEYATNNTLYYTNNENRYNLPVEHFSFTESSKKSYQNMDADEYIFNENQFDIYFKTLNQPYATDIVIHDFKDKNIYLLRNNLFIRNIKKGKSGVYFLEYGPNGTSQLRVITKKGENKFILAGWADNGSNTTSIKDYELLTNKQINITYTTDKGSQNQIIDISDVIE